MSTPSTARVTGLPLYNQDGKHYVHLGLGLSQRSPIDDSVTFGAKPEANLAPNYVSATIPAESLTLIGAEAAWVSGPLSVQGEYTMAAIDAPRGFLARARSRRLLPPGELFPDRRDPRLQQGRWLLAGLKPDTNAFAKDGGNGAWELGLRYSSIDLTDSGLDER